MSTSLSMAFQVVWKLRESSTSMTGYYRHGCVRQAASKCLIGLYLSIRIALRTVVAFLFVCVWNFSRLSALILPEIPRGWYLTMHDEYVHYSDGS